MAASQPKIFTNMYKEPATIDTRNLKKLLATLSIGDAKHDFKFPIENKATVKDGNLKTEEIQGAINYGLPEDFGYDTNNILPEEDCLSSVIANYITNLTPTPTEVTRLFNNGASGTELQRVGEYNPISVGNPDFKANESTHEVTTINGNRFNVNYANLRPQGRVASMLNIVTGNSPEIPADEFYRILQLEPSRRIAIIVDAASIGLYEILNKGTFTSGVRPNIYYIYGAEVVNDPATKKTPESKVFFKETGGVNLISCLPNITTLPIYNYKFSDPSISTSYLEQFYTKYNFALSDIKTNIKGKSSEYITNLTITGNPHQVNPIINSKSKNDITFLKSILDNFLKLFNKKRTITDDEKFLFSSSIQQKRSGDWLQVLLCAAIKDKLRVFKRYDDHTDITNEIQDVFFVTHDRIALAFALLNGINCFFTHHNSSNHFHSVLAYKLNDPVANDIADRNLAKKYKNEILNLQATIIRLIDEINRYMSDTYNINVNNRNDILNVHIRQIIDNINDSNRTNKITNFDNNYDVAHFRRDVRAIFSEALELIFAKSLYSNLSNELATLNLLRVNINTLLGPSINTSDIIKNYRDITTTINNIELLYNKSNNITLDAFRTSTLNFKKSHIYKSAVEWNWDINLSSRQIQHMSNIEERENYNTDRNIFLYNLNQLEEDVKIRIAWIYYKLYDYLSRRCELTTEDITSNTVSHFVNTEQIRLGTRNYKKFRAISLSFCIEVVLNLGGNNGLNVDNDSVTGINITNILDAFLQKNSVAISLLITDTLVVSEDNNYNTAVVKGSTLSENNPLILNVNSNINDTTPEQVSDDIDIAKDIPVVITGGQNHISGGAFETTIKQVTYPLMTFILNASGVYSSWQKVAGTFLNVLATISNPNLDSYLNEYHTPTVRTSFLQNPIGFQNPFRRGTELSELSSPVTLSNPYQSVTNFNQDEIVSTPSLSEDYTPSHSLVKPNTTRPPNIQNYVVQPVQSLPIVKTAKRKQTVPHNVTSFKGGSKESLKKLYESLPPLPEDTPLADFDESFDVFSDNTICFHPLLPTYMLTQTYMSSVNNENIEESLDFDIFVNYLKFLKKIKENVVQIYSGENNNNENKMEAYAIGLGLKQLLFVSNNNNEGYQNCLEVLGTNNEIYSKASSLTENLVFAVSGRVTYSETDLHLGNIFLNSDLFKSFARNLEVDKIFGFYADSTNFNLSQFRAEILDFSSQLANQIISDRTINQTPLETILSEPLSQSASPTGYSLVPTASDVVSPANLIHSEYHSERVARAAALKNSSSSSSIETPKKLTPAEILDKGKANPRIMTYSELQKRDKTSTPSSGIIQYVTSSTSSSGGKKTRKYRRHLKNKKTKRKNRRTRRKTTRKNRRARKNNTSRK